MFYTSFRTTLQRSRPPPGSCWPEPAPSETPRRSAPSSSCRLPSCVVTAWPETQPETWHAQVPELRSHTYVYLSAKMYKEVNMFTLMYQDGVHLSQYRAHPTAPWTLEGKRNGWHCSSQTHCDILITHNIDKLQAHSLALYTTAKGVHRYITHTKTSSTHISLKCITCNDQLLIHKSSVRQFNNFKRLS